MVRFMVCTATVALAAAGVVVIASHHVSPAQAKMAGGPARGYTLHIDAEKHFGDAHPSEIAHHWCKNVSSTLKECLLYDSDAPDARLVGVETVVPTAVWKTFAPSERALWHYHVTELAKVHATLPDTPKDEQAKVIAMIKPTYGKIWILWDPLTSKNPIGQPTIVVLH
jgi:hypothetical protein